MAKEKSLTIQRIHRNRIIRSLFPNMSLLQNGHRLGSLCPYCKTGSLSVIHVFSRIKSNNNYIISLTVSCNGCKELYEAAVLYNCENGHMDLIRYKF